MNRSVKDPKLDELLEACKRLGFAAESQEAKHPLRMMLKSGYVSLPKKGNLKAQLIDHVSKTLADVRGERSASAAASQSIKDTKRPLMPTGKKH